MATLSLFLLLAGASAAPHSAAAQSCNSVADGYTCFPSIARNWGEYAPFFSLAAESTISPAIPESCDITFVQALTRHGARYPTSSKNTKYKALIEEIQSNATSFTGEYAFLQTYNYSLSSDVLTPFGELEMYQAGIKFYTRYESLARDHVPFVRSSSSERVIESSEQFNAGFQATKEADRKANRKQTAPTINVVLEETTGFNNSLDPSTCTNFENSETGDDATDTWAAVFVPPILARVEKNLPGMSFSTTDIIYLMDMCSFDTVARTADASELSPFCALFSEAEWVQYNYYQTLGKYYGYGGGNVLGAAQGVGFTNEVIARLTQKAVQDDTSTNHTLDASSATFPLDAVLYADFSHDDGLEPIFFAMGLYNSTAPLSNTSVESVDQTNGYSAAWSVPYSARAYIEMMTCQNHKQPLVRVLINDRVIPLHGCAVDSLGRCTRDDFVQGLSFARQGGNWAACFT
ncbi:hypothetical protein ASPZODRAFT_132351 [Penicilliopsis zonata CBS 506.65]|uniref:Phytase A n=1 Tax=Penicilliopsis zonata CBS 506.65 TaxID=1073090 RepID=A0A1L9SJL5_9EURO|nr:hypothetical protein ASPZODRAFT_132351 [Penicilliopsis zonata CBS 506.65]OJJ47355.1 hypothetical protein ASPZODRAFT_132351 [Penicilliopsis zonata CBS 506.65]